MKSTVGYSFVFACFLALTACGGGGGGGESGSGSSSGGSSSGGSSGGSDGGCTGLSCDEDPAVPFEFSQVSLGQGSRPGYLKISWASNVADANERAPEYFAVSGLHAEVLEDAELLVDEISLTESSAEFQVPVHLLNPNPARLTGYYVEALPWDTAGATTESLGLVQADQVASEALIAYIKPSLVAESTQYGLHTAVSSTGNLVAVAAPYYPDSGRNGFVGIHVRGELGQWVERDLISPPDDSGYFGVGGVHLSAAGDRLVVVSSTVEGARLVDIYQYEDGEWQHVHGLPPADSFVADRLGRAAVALSGDGSTLAEARMTSTGPVVLLYALGSDAVPVESQQLTPQYYHADNNPSGFGMALSLSDDGGVLAVGAPYDTIRPSEIALGEKPDTPATSDDYYGAVYMFRRGDSTWEQSAVLKERWDPKYALEFGGAVAVSGDGSVVAVGARLEGGADSGVEGLPPEESVLEGAGAAYIFNSNPENPWSDSQDFVTEWSGYLKPHVSRANVNFGMALGLSADGRVLAVGNPYESGGSTGVWGDPSDLSKSGAGSAHMYVNSDGSWKLGNYIKSSNSDSEDVFGWSLAISADGRTLVAGAPGEGSASGSAQSGNSAPSAGAIYVY